MLGKNFSFLILNIILVLIFVSCAPLPPLAPKTSQKTGGQASQTQELTGIDSWDSVLSQWIGTPYLYGGNTKNGTDCSGFVSSVYLEKEGMHIPRSSSEEFKMGKSVEKKNLAVGDLVFFGKKGKVNHVGIYVGQGNFIHASTSLGVTVTPLDDNHWKSIYMGARRYL